VVDDVFCIQVLPGTTFREQAGTREYTLGRLSSIDGISILRKK
jgi:hypothetical protein